MTAPTPRLATPVDLSGIRRSVDHCLADFLDRKARTAAVHHMPAEAVSVLRRFLLGGGKRLRPLLCVCGWHAADGEGDTTAIIQVAASLEMFHAFALIHDDVMDRSPTRRGAPTVHRAIATLHRGERGRPGAERLGTGAAILIGDLALTWSDELLHTAGLPSDRLTAVLPVIDTMRAEVMYGQYLDLLSTGVLSDDVDIPLTVIRYKTAKYTVERPLHIGAALAGADPHTFGSLTDYALPLGEAFQLRDDLLGVFGDPRKTGKSRLDDLREGKHTVLMALALRNAAPEQQDVLHLLVGNAGLDDAGAARVRDVLTATGARSRVEQMIHGRSSRAHEVLRRAAFPRHATRALHTIADSATRRSA
ncbi:polyprenyl synthetase family protein [Streptomyces klenkii]